LQDNNDAKLNPGLLGQKQQSTRRRLFFTNKLEFKEENIKVVQMENCFVQC